MTTAVYHSMTEIFEQVKATIKLLRIEVTHSLINFDAEILIVDMDGKVSVVDHFEPEHLITYQSHGKGRLDSLLWRTHDEAVTRCLLLKSFPKKFITELKAFKFFSRSLINDNSFRAVKSLHFHHR